MSDTTPFLYRPHRGALEESMRQVKAFTTKAELVLEAQRFYQDFMPADTITSEKVIIKPYIYDERIGWDTHIVIVEGIGPIGFTDRMVS